MNDTSSGLPQGDLLGPGVPRIADGIGIPHEVLRGLVARKCKHVPLFKIGGRWYARRSKLAAALEALIAEQEGAA